MRGGRLGAPGHVVRVAEPDRPGRRRAGPRQPEEPEGRDPEELSLEVVQRRVERRLGRLLARGRGEALADVLECERVGADERPVVVDETHGRFRRLVVALDRRSLAVTRHALVRQGDLDDVGVVRSLARDDERLGELQADDPGGDLHPGTYWDGVAMETTYATTSACSCPATMAGGITPRPCWTTADTVAASRPEPASVGPTPPPWPPSP